MSVSIFHLCRPWLAVPFGLAGRCCFLVVVLWGMALFPPWARAQEFIVGQVVSVDREQGEVVLQVAAGVDPLDSGGPADPASQGGTPPPRKEHLPLTLTMAETALQPGLPGCVQPGRVIRAWGRFADDGKSVFVADAVRGGGPGQGEDRSGVRARLHRCRESGPYCPGGRRSLEREGASARPGPP